MPGKTRKQMVFSQTGGYDTGRPRALLVLVVGGERSTGLSCYEYF